MTSRVRLIKASGLPSSYKKTNDPNERWDISVFKELSYITADMFEALVSLQDQVTQQQGELYITDLLRTWETQENARNSYLDGTKKAFVAPPGTSFHQAGRAVDFSVKELNFKNVPKEKWLEKFWDMARPLGFRPIIQFPDLSLSECWHFDFPGLAWNNAYDYKNKSSSDHVDYGYVARACILDSGRWDPKELPSKTEAMFIQSQLVRLGFYEIGAIDGVIGAKTKKILSQLELNFRDNKKICDILVLM